MLPNEAVDISEGDRIDFELTSSIGVGRAFFGAGVGAAAGAASQAVVAAAAGSHAEAAAAQGLAGAHFGAQGLQDGPNRLNKQVKGSKFLPVH